MPGSHLAEKVQKCGNRFQWTVRVFNPRSFPLLATFTVDMGLVGARPSGVTSAEVSSSLEA